MTTLLWTAVFVCAILVAVKALRPRPDDEDLKALFEKDHREQGGGAL